MLLAEADQINILEAAGVRQWRVLLISAGKSKNSKGLVYGSDALRSAVQEGVFEGVPAKALRFGKLFAHLPKPVQRQFPQGFADVVVGAFTESRWDDALQGVTATLTLAEGNPWFEPLLKLSHRLGGKVFGWSIDGEGTLQEGTNNVVEKIVSVDSVDFVTAAARGGRTLEPLEEQLITSFAESIDAGEPKGGTMKDKIRKLLDKVRQHNAALLEGVDVEALVESEDLDKALELLEAAFAEKKVEPEKKPVKKTGITEGDDDPLEALREEMRVERDKVVADIRLDAALAKAKLPDECKAVIRESLEGNSPTDAQIQEGINRQLELVKALGGTTEKRGRVQTLMEGRDKLTAGLAALMECDLSDEEKKITPFRGLQEAYVEITGDSDLRGRIDPAVVGLEEAALASNTWTNVWETVGSRRMQKEFMGLPGMGKSLASSVRGTRDFKNIEVSNIGGYGELPTVAQGGTYSDLGIPGDRKVTYAVSKRGGTVQITLEAVRADDIGGIARMIQNLARAARVTEDKIILYTTLLSNPTWADGTAVFAAGRSNIYTSYNFTDAPWTVMKQIRDGMWAVTLTDLAATATDVETLGLSPWFLVAGQASREGIETVLGVETKRYGNDSADSQANPYYRMFGANNERVLITPRLSTASVTAVAVANPQVAETLEVAYLDNKQEPELFRQDQPTIGSMFTNDAMDLKIRFILGATVLDPRSFFGVFAS